MARQNTSKKPLPSSAREQFFVYLYGYLAHNGFSELARALAREARFSPNTFPPLDYIEQWWSLMWPVYQELRLGASSDIEFPVPPGQLNSNVGNKRSFRVPPNIRETPHESVNPSSLLPNQHLQRQRGPQSVQIQGRPNLAAQSLAQQQALNQAMWAQSMNKNPEHIQRQQDEQNERFQMRLKFNQQQEIQQRLQQQQQFQRQQQQLMQNQQIQNQQQMQQMHLNVVGQDEGNSSEGVGSTNDNQAKPPLKQRKSSVSVNKVLKQKLQGKPKPVSRRSSSNQKQQRRLTTQSFQEDFTDTPNSEPDRGGSHINIKLRSPLPILIPGQGPLKARRKVSTSKQQIKIERKKSISSLRIPSPSPTNPLSGSEFGASAAYGNINEDVKQSVMTQGQFPNATQMQQGLNSAGNAFNYSGNGFSDIFSDFSQSSLQANFPPTLFQDPLSSTIEPSNGYLSGSALTSGLTGKFTSASDAPSFPLLVSNNFTDPLKIEQGDMVSSQFSGLYNTGADSMTAQSNGTINNMSTDSDTFTNFFPESTMSLPFH